eukprot:gb/GECG01000836.1/.p1 GENE.gb/GECG01000836.1/~~gb/GECG01000836.1/.p1  ORF type:complete len:3386 (+),score=415.52 gb/GECG01000836.1/:1-10158(+)
MPSQGEETDTPDNTRDERENTQPVNTECQKEGQIQQPNQAGTEERSSSQRQSMSKQQADDALAAGEETKKHLEGLGYRAKVNYDVAKRALKASSRLVAVIQQHAPRLSYGSDDTSNQAYQDGAIGEHGNPAHVTKISADLIYKIVKALTDKRHANDGASDVTIDLLFGLTRTLARSQAVVVRVLAPILELIWDVDAPFHRMHGVKLDGNELEWRESINTQTRLDAFHEDLSCWVRGTVTATTSQGALKVTFDDLPEYLDAWFTVSSENISPLDTFAKTPDQILDEEPWRIEITRGSEIDVYDTSGRWISGEVTDARTKSFFGSPNRQFQFSWRAHNAPTTPQERLSNTSCRIAYPGTHTSDNKKSFGWAAVETERIGSSYASVYTPYYLRHQGNPTFSTKHGSEACNTMLKDLLNEFRAEEGVLNTFNTLYFDSEVDVVVPSRTTTLVCFLKAFAGTVLVESGKWLQVLGQDLLELTKRLLGTLSDPELRDFRAEDWRSIGLSLRKILYASEMTISAAATLLEKTCLEVASTFFRSTVLAQRIQGIKVIEDACRATRENDTYYIDAEEFSRWLIENIVPSLFDARTTHKALIERSAEVVGLLLDLKAVDEEVLTWMWEAASIETGATDADIRSKVFDVLYNICPLLSSKSIASLIHRFACVPTYKLPPSGIQLVQHLAADKTHYSRISHMALQFLWCILSDTDVQISKELLDEDQFQDLKQRSNEEVLQCSSDRQVQMQETDPKRPPMAPGPEGRASVPRVDADSQKKEVPLPVLQAARKSFIKLVKVYELQHMRIPYVISCVELIQKDVNCPLALRILREIIDSFNVKAIRENEVTKSMIAEYASKVSNLENVVIESCNRLHSKALTWKQNTEKNKGEIASAVLANEAYFSYAEALKSRMDFLTSILSTTTLVLDWHQVSTLWSCLYDNAICELDREVLLQFLQSACESFGNSKFFGMGVAEKLYTDFIIKRGEQNLSLDNVYFSCVRSYFLAINEWNRSLDRAVGSSDQEIMVFRPPEQMTGTWYLWTIALEAELSEVATAAIDFLLKLYTQLAPNFDDYMAENSEGADKPVTAVDVKAAFVDRCVKKLQGSLELANATATAVAGRCLQALQRLVADADSRGHGGLRPHFTRTGGGRLHLKFNSSVPSMKGKPIGPSYFELDVSATACLWDLREAVATKVHLNPGRVKLIEGGKVLSDYQNADSLVEVGLKNHCTILVNHCQPPRPPEAALLINGDDFNEARMTPATEEALAEIFSRFSTDGTMSQTLFKCYIIACGVAGSNIAQDRIDDIFRNHETTESGELTQGGFLEFYRVACCKRPDSVRKDLRHHGYDTRTLRLRNNDVRKKIFDMHEVENIAAGEKTSSQLPAGVTPEVAAVARKYGVDLAKEDVRQEGDLEMDTLSQSSNEDLAEAEDFDDDTIRSNPRLVLTMNPDYFDTLFDALSAPHSVSIKAWELLQRLPSNPTILKGLETVKNDASKVKWSELLPTDQANSCKLLYTLQIVDGYLDDNVGRLVNEVNNMSSSGCSVQKLDEETAPSSTANADQEMDGSADEENSGVEFTRKWRINFAQCGGFSHVLEIVNEWQVGSIWESSADENDVMVGIRRFCLCALLRVIRFFVIGAAMTTSSVPYSSLMSFTGMSAFKEDILSMNSNTEGNNKAGEGTSGEKGNTAYTAGADDPPAATPAAPSVAESGPDLSLDPVDHVATSDTKMEEKKETANACYVCASHSSENDLLEEFKANGIRNQILTGSILQKLSCKIRTLIDGICKNGNIYDVALMTQSLTIWLTLCLERPAFVDELTDVNGLEHSSFTDMLLRLLLCPFSDAIRTETANAVYHLCHHIDRHSHADVGDLTARILLERVTVLLGESSLMADPVVYDIFGRYTETPVSVAQCSRQFFGLLNLLLRDSVCRQSSTLLQQFRENRLAYTLVEWLRRHEPVEKRIASSETEDGTRAVLGEYAFDWKQIPTGQKAREVDGEVDEDCVLIGVLELLNVMFCNMPEVIRESWRDYDGCGELLSLLLSRCLFFVPHALEDLDESQQAKLPMCSRSKSRTVAFDVLTTICTMEPGRAGTVAKTLIPILNSSSKVNSFRYTPSSAQRSTCGYVGLKNLGCTCYMNSMLQQLFMIPRFRYGVLDAPASVEVEDEYRDDVDEDDKSLTKAAREAPQESMLFQLQRLFGFLCLSDRQDYNPRPFCSAFRPLGEPVNVLQQQDAEEFVTFFMDMVDNVVQGTRQEGLVKRYLTGSTITQIVDPSNGRILSERQEPFHHLTLTVKNHKNVEEALESLIQGETIEDYHYEPEDRRMTITRRSRLGRLPANLVLHCKRFEFNLETFQVDKVNSRFEFPDSLSLWPYTKQGCEKDAGSQEQAHYEYRLAGVVCHVGTAGAGHYYSFIRDRVNGNWYEFNDSIIRPFDPSKLEEETFGGSSDSMYLSTSWATDSMMSDSSRNAYLLVYDKVIPQEGSVDAMKLEGALRGYEYTPPEVITEAPQTPPLVNSDTEEKSRTSQEQSFTVIDDEFSTKLRWLSQALKTTAAPEQRVEDEFTVCRSRDKIPGHTTTRPGLWRSLLPPRILKDVFDDNVRFLIDQSIYSREFFDFMSMTFRNFEKLLDSESAVAEYRDSISQLAEVYVPFALDTLAHAAEHNTFPDINKAMRNIVCQSEVAAKQLLRCMYSSPSSYSKVLFECADGDIRRETSRLIVVCLNTVLCCREEQTTLERDSRTVLAYRGENSGRCVPAEKQDMFQSTVGQFLHGYLLNLETAVSSVYRFEQYFEVLAEAAAEQPFVRRFLLSFGCVEMLIDAFMDSQSPFKYIRAENHSTRKKEKMHTPLWTKMLQTVSLLVRSVRLPGCVREGTGAAAAAARVLRNSYSRAPGEPPTALSESLEAHLDEHLLNLAYEGKLDPSALNDAPFPPLAMMVCTLLTCSSFFEKALKSSAETESTTLMLQYLCWENPNFTNIACQAVSHELMFSAQYYTVDLHFDVVDGLLEMEDSLQSKRVAMILGDPHVAMQREHLVGHGLMSINVGCRDLLLANDTSQAMASKTILLSGVGRGLLASMYNRRYSSARWTYCCLSRLLLIMEKLECVRAYIWSIPSPSHLAKKRRYTCWADWFYPWLFRYCEGLTATVQPDRNQVLDGIDKLRKLIAIRDKCDLEVGRHRPALAETPNLEFYLYRLDGEVVSHSYNTEVTCTSHAWTDPEGTDRMAFKVVNDKRQSMTFRLYIEKTKSEGLNFDMPEDHPIEIMLGYRQVRYLHPVVKKDPESPWGGFRFSWRYELLKDEKTDEVIPPDTESDDEMNKSDTTDRVQRKPVGRLEVEPNDYSDSDQSSTNAKASPEGHTPPGGPEDEEEDNRLERSDSEFARALQRQLDDNSGTELIDFNPDPSNDQDPGQR